MVLIDCCPILTGADRLIPRVLNDEVESGRGWDKNTEYQWNCQKNQRCPRNFRMLRMFAFCSDMELG